MSLHEYVEEQRKRLDAALTSEFFGTACPRMATLYQLSMSAVPKVGPRIFAQFLLLCHKSFLAAATLIGQGQPDDAGPITRRAIEVAKLAAAMKNNHAVLEKWGAYESRLKRWQDRHEGKKPNFRPPRIPTNDQLAQRLLIFEGIYSDVYVHFTPEYLISRNWQEHDDGIFLSYFDDDGRTIEQAVLHLLDTHMTILMILNACFDGAFNNSAEWHKLADEVFAIAKPYAKKFETRPSA